jgi:hypothetical protein
MVHFRSNKVLSFKINDFLCTKVGHDKVGRTRKECRFTVIDSVESGDCRSWSRIHLCGMFKVEYVIGEIYLSNIHVDVTCGSERTPG